MKKTIWDILELDETNDKLLIKKAYAKKSKTVHPEEDPVGFRELYDAYKSALRLGKEGQRNYIATSESNKVVKDQQENIDDLVDNNNRIDEIIFNQIEKHTEEMKWIFTKMEELSKSTSYDDWHDDAFWDNIMESKEFNKYKFSNDFLDSFTPYIIGNHKIIDKYLLKIYNSYGFNNTNAHNIEDNLYPLYLYLNDRLFGYLNIANTCIFRLWFCTALSVILFIFHRDSLLLLLICSIIMTCKTFLYRIPKFNNEKTASININESLNRSYSSAFFQIVVQYTFCVIQFYDMRIMPMTIEILTIVLFLFSIVKKYKNFEIVECYYQCVFLALSVWGCLINDQDQIIVILYLSIISLIIVYIKWIVKYSRMRMLKDKKHELFAILKIYLVTICAQVFLCLLSFFLNK